MQHFASNCRNYTSIFISKCSIGTRVLPQADLKWFVNRSQLFNKVFQIYVHQRIRHWNPIQKEDRVATKLIYIAFGFINGTNQSGNQGVKFIGLVKKRIHRKAYKTINKLLLLGAVTHGACVDSNKLQKVINHCQPLVFLKWQVYTLSAWPFQVCIDQHNHIRW